MQTSIDIPRRARVALAALVGADFVSQLGNQVAAVAIPVLMLQFTGSPLATAFAASANALPLVLAAFVGGRVIDRAGAWGTSIAADLLSLVGVLALPLAVLMLASPPAWLLVALVFVGALFDSTGVAARQTLVAGIASEARHPLARVNALRGALENGADWAGPALAGLLIALLGVSIALLANAASFLFSALALAVLVPRGPMQRAAAAPAGAGSVDFGYVCRAAYLRPLLLGGLLTAAVLTPFLALLLPLLMVRRFADPFLLGAALSAFGLAATLGALAFPLLEARLRRTSILYGGLLLTGLCMGACGLVDDALQVVPLAFGAGLLLGAGNPLEQTVLQEFTPPMVAGQVFTRFAALRQAAAPPALLLWGALAERVDVGTLLLAAGALLVLGALLCWRFQPVPGGKPPQA